MKIHNKLDELLKNSSKVKILRFLFFEKDEHTGRAIAKSINMSASSTYENLQKLKEEGLISVRKKGNSILHKIRLENHIVKKLLRPLFEQEKSIQSDIISLVKRSMFKYRKKIASMALFGSVAKKGETSKSDIDLLIIVEHGPCKAIINKAIDKLSTEIAKKYGTALSTYVLTRSEIRQKYNKKQAIIRSILQNNQLIFGEPIERIVA